MIYRFILITDRRQSVHDLDLRDDLTARRMAAENSACVSVETLQHRNVWRKPLTDSELTQLMTRGKLRTGKTNFERPVAMPGFQGDLTEWLDREK